MTHLLALFLTLLLPLQAFASVNPHLSALNATSSATVQSVVTGEDFGKALTTQLKFAGANIVGTPLSNAIGGAFGADGALNNLGQAAGHLAVGCLSGSIANGSCGGGAAGAVTAEFAAEYAHNNLGYSVEKSAEIGKFAAAMAGVLVQDGARGVTAAYQAGGTAVENNYLSHQHLEAWQQQVDATCKGDAACEKTKVREFMASQVAADTATSSNPALQGEFVYCDALCQQMVEDTTGLQGNALLAMTVPGDAVALGSAGKGLWTVATTEGIAAAGASVLNGGKALLSEIGSAVKGGFGETTYIIRLTDSTTNYYFNKIDLLDVATEPNTAVFYSGPGNRALAEEFARIHGKTTLEMTPGGKWLDEQGLYDFLPDSQADRIWRRLSQRYADEASGNVIGFVQGARPKSIFNDVEYPILIDNPKITNVITGGH